ncbi:arrestin-domain-containing protein [Aspergillus terreus]|uniref:Arrestin-domain-containing protein n=1 Tax=Aspergillus terreus TaxID=33178 RepID=A0A5M3Z7U1_ASPTE|nr:hypothetical protein ATETN484_0011022900 [Aspergillus terreus]GFF18866.1 arrestin-domain-containing protein [Aspergillus terreus]
MARRRGSRDTSGDPALDINIAEPAVFIPTYTHNPAVLRGSCTLELKESYAVKKLTVNFRGVSHVLWPHGFRDKRTVTNCNFTVYDPKDSDTGEGQNTSSGSREPMDAGVNRPPRKRCKLWRAIMNRCPSGRKDSAGLERRLLSPGTYTYSFEMILPSHLPESINVRRSHVQYNVRACIESHGLWSRKITQNKPITAVHCPAEDFVDDAEPVYVTRTWRKLIRCEIIVSRRGAALGRHLPVAFAFSELAMAKVRGVQIYLLENVQYLQRNGVVSCCGPFKRLRLYEMKDDSILSVSDSRRSSADDGRPSDEERDDCSGKEKPDHDRMAKPTDMDGTTIEVELPLPVCQIHSTDADGVEKNSMHFDTRYKNVQVNHWLEFVFFVAKNGFCDPDAPTVQKSTKIPFLLRSCYAHQANASLPAYTQSQSGKQSCTDSVVEYVE